MATATGPTVEGLRQRTSKYAVVTDPRFAGGAKGDGSTNDYAAINAAIQFIDQASHDGGVVYFPSGSYNVGTVLKVPAHIYLVGENCSGTRLLYTGGSTSEPFITFGVAGQISVNSGMRWLAADTSTNAPTVVKMFGPQEGSHLIGCLLTGGTRYGVDIVSSGIVGGSNKFVVEKCWIWTQNDAGEAGIHFDAGAGPLTIADTTFVGVNRASYPQSGPAGSAGIKTEGGYFIINDVNVEHFESHTHATSSNLVMNTPTCFFTTYGVTLNTTNTATIIENCSFDNVTACLRNTAKNFTVPFFTNFRYQAYESDRRSLSQNFWSLGSQGIYSGTGDREAQLGFSVYGNADTTRFKINVIKPGGNGWNEVANVDDAQTFGTGSGAWNGNHFHMGSYHLWIDSSGRLRIKNGVPTSDTDGTVVGTQT